MAPLCAGLCGWHHHLHSSQWPARHVRVLKREHWVLGRKSNFPHYPTASSVCLQSLCIAWLSCLPSRHDRWPPRDLMLGKLIEEENLSAWEKKNLRVHRGCGSWVSYILRGYWFLSVFTSWLCKSFLNAKANMPGEYYSHDPCFTKENAKALSNQTTHLSSESRFWNQIFRYHFLCFFLLTQY